MVKPSHGQTLRLIAVFKFCKALCLLGVGISALKLIHGDAAATLTHWITSAGLNPGGRYIDRALGTVASLPPVKFKELGIGSFVYAALFLLEGSGLWLQKRWGEWVTVAITGSLIPLEVYELGHHPTAAKALMLVVNAGVVVYLLRNIKQTPAG